MVFSLRAFSLALFGGIAASAPRAEAAGPAPAVALAYEAPAGCPDATFFVREVGARTSRVTFDQQRATRSFQVLVRSAPGSFAGFLWINDARGPGSERRFEAANCEDVIEALALVAALAVDPNASLAPSARAEEGAGLPDGTREPPPVREPAPRPPPVVPPALPADLPARDRPSRTSAGAWTWATGPAFGVLTATSPPLVGIGWFVELGRDGSGFAPLARLLPSLAQTGVTGPSGEAAEFRLIGARLEGCPLNLVLARDARVRPCLGVDAGSLRARGIGAARPREDERLWVSAVLDLRLQLSVVNGFFVEVAGGPAFPITRPVFVFERPLIVVHEVPGVVAHASLAGGAQFP